MWKKYPKSRVTTDTPSSQIQAPTHVRRRGAAPAAIRYSFDGRRGSARRRARGYETNRATRRGTLLGGWARECSRDRPPTRLPHARVSRSRQPAALPLLSPSRRSARRSKGRPIYFHQGSRPVRKSVSVQGEKMMVSESLMSACEREGERGGAADHLTLVVVLRAVARALELVLSLVPGHDAAECVHTALMPYDSMLPCSVTTMYVASPWFAKGAGGSVESVSGENETGDATRESFLLNLPTGTTRPARRWELVAIRAVAGKISPIRAPYPRPGGVRAARSRPGRARGRSSRRIRARDGRARGGASRRVASGAGFRGRTLRPWDRVWSPGRWVLSRSSGLDVRAGGVLRRLAGTAAAAAVMMRRGRWGARSSQRDGRTTASDDRRRRRGPTVKYPRPSSRHRALAREEKGGGP